MAIYDFSNAKTESSPVVPQQEEAPASPHHKRDQFFSAVAARLFFLLLLLGCGLWVVYCVAQFAFSVLGYCCTGGRVNYFKVLSEKAWVSLRRSLVCGVCLLVALFSPSFGIMIACTYFLMYDKTGIEEVVPASLQSQFKEFLSRE